MSSSPSDEDALLDPSTLVERALESVLDQVPDLPDFATPESEVRIQPWADVAAPAGKNKRALEELLEEFAQRVAAAPEAKAGVPSDKPAAAAYLDRFSRGTGAMPGGGAASGRSKRRRRRGKGSGSGEVATGASGSPDQRQQRPQGGGRPPQGSAGRVPGGGGRNAPAGGQGGAGAPGTAKRRRRGRRRPGGGGSGGSGGSAGGTGAPAPGNA